MPNYGYGVPNYETGTPYNDVGINQGGWFNDTIDIIESGLGIIDDALNVWDRISGTETGGQVRDDVVDTGGRMVSQGIGDFLRENWLAGIVVIIAAGAGLFLLIRAAK
jgi:hypothetical protein